MKTKMNKLVTILLILVILGGCTNEPQPSIDKIKDKVMIVEEESDGGIKYDKEYEFDENTSVGMLQLMNNNLASVIELNEENLNNVFIDEFGDDVRFTIYPNIFDTAFKINDQRVDITVGFTTNNEYWNARVTGVFKDEVNWYILDYRKVMEDIRYLINRATGLFFEGYHDEIYGENVIEEEPIVVYFEGGDTDEYLIYIEHKFKTVEDYDVKLYGNLKKLTEKDWYSGIHFCSVVNERGEYRLGEYATSPCLSY